jgi:hypothetical protein
MFTTITLAVCGGWLVLWALASQTKNFISSLIYTIIPFFLGLACILAFLGRIGIVSGI